MRRKCRRPGAKYRALHQWHKWFAWHPVYCHPEKCVWLETVERKGRFWMCFSGCGWDWKYRIKNNEG